MRSKARALRKITKTAPQVLDNLHCSKSNPFEVSPLLSEPLQQLTIVLCAPSHPGNIGAAARAMKTMGVSELRLVNPYDFPSEVATARASGATDVLDSAKVFSSLAEAIADCVFVVGTSARHREFAGEVVPLRSAIESLRANAAQSKDGKEGKVALVFGTEMSGMTNDEVMRCQTLAYIPSNPAYSSLNLGSAVQVACYEWRVIHDLPANYALREYPLAPQKDVELFFAHLEKTLTDLHFFNPEMPRRLFERLRRLFARTRMEREEVDIFRGILARVDAVIKNTKP
jgi:tRNA/rRNA methyltransferase